MDEIEVDVDGSITSFPMDQSSITFTFQANLGQITGTPSARVRAHCNVHGWSSWSEPLQIPKFPSWIILPLLVVSAFVVAMIQSKITKKFRF